MTARFLHTFQALGKMRPPCVSPVPRAAEEGQTAALQIAEILRCAQDDSEGPRMKPFRRFPQVLKPRFKYLSRPVRCFVPCARRSPHLAAGSPSLAPASAILPSARFTPSRVRAGPLSPVKRPTGAAPVLWCLRCPEGTPGVRGQAQGEALGSGARRSRRRRSFAPRRPRSHLLRIVTVLAVKRLPTPGYTCSLTTRSSLNYSAKAAAWNSRLTARLKDCRTANLDPID